MNQKLYHSVSVVGTLLLQIGEVGERLDRKSVEKKSFETVNTYFRKIHENYYTFEKT